MATASNSFPRQHARTQRFTLGVPRACTVSPDGARVVFLRSPDGADRSHALWVHEVASGQAHLAADPRQLLGGSDEELSALERARRERSREGSAGIVGYATDREVRRAAFALSGRLFVTDLPTGRCRELPAGDPVVDPRPSPDGRLVAYAAAGGLRVISAEGSAEGSEDRALAEPDGPAVSWGVAEFIAAEEMQRSRGFWWSPDSDRLLVTRVDEGPVHRWWIADPADPAQQPAEVAYPAAGTPNAEVSLYLQELDGDRTEVRWDRERFPYLARVHWSSCGPPLLLVQARDQRSQQYLTVDPATGRTTVELTEQDPVWLELFPGSPDWTPDGRLVRITDRDGARVLMIGDRPVTDAALHLRAVLDVGDRDVLFSASPGDGLGRFHPAEGSAEGSAEDGADRAGDRAAPGRIGVFRAPLDAADRTGGRTSGGAAEGMDDRAGPVGPPPEWFVTPAWQGVASAVRGGDTLVLFESVLDRPGPQCTVQRPADGAPQRTRLASYAQRPVITAKPLLAHAGKSMIPTAVLLPTGYRDGDGPLPVLMDPYGGPHGQRVVAAHNAHLSSQWFADQGFAVVVADGRGTPGHAPAWEKAVAGDLAGVTLADQVEALHALAESHPLDLSRVGIRGWSYGGYLAALAVLRRPDVFHAGIAGAPVTDWRLYDTHYTERYLGLPQQDARVWLRNSVVGDEGLSEPAAGRRPLMVVHGLADDNVVAAHTLRLSSALLAAGRPHEVLPLSGVTHMTPQEQVAENLLLLQVDFLQRSLGVA